jgi:1,4-dihydroxy-2-naphthoate octaprenyltransferase
LNEFLDYPADLMAEKSNMVVRFGRDKASFLFGITTVGSYIAVLYSLNNGVPIQVFWLYLPIITLSAISAVLVMSKRWYNGTTLNKRCATTLVVNLGTTTSYIVAFAR